MMTRKDFQAMARYIAAAQETEKQGNTSMALHNLIGDLLQDMIDSNPRFDTARFWGYVATERNKTNA